MQVPNSIIAVAVEIYAVLFLVTIILLLHARKLKLLIKRQQDKLLELLREKKLVKKSPAAAPPNPTQSYKNYLHDVIEATMTQYALTFPNNDIGAEHAVSSPALQRILALRYAYLRAEELGTTEPIGSAEYWSLFQQTLAPLLTSMPDIASSNNNEELDTYKKRVENLEKFKRLFFDMEKQWELAQANAKNHYEQLTAMSSEVSNKEHFDDVLQQYHGVYDDIYKTVINNLESPDEPRTIHITRQDPRAAEEIVKLRNVAADQHRVINQLQRKLMEAKTTTEKELVIDELQQQLQRQIRFVQESETCIQLLEEELSKAHAELSMQDKTLSENSSIGKENQQMKEALHNFSIESKDLMKNFTELKKEHEKLKHSGANIQSAAEVTSPNKESPELKKIQQEHKDLQKNYAELEEKYLTLKLGN
jgi:hypothetical protein